MPLISALDQRLGASVAAAFGCARGIPCYEY